MIVIGTLLVIYIGVAVWAIDRYIRMRRDLIEREILEAQGDYQKYILQEDAIRQEKAALEDEVAEVYTLYDMTKEITKVVNETEAADIFRERLSDHVSFETCRLLGPLDPEARDAKKQPGLFVFPLRGKKELLGHVVIGGAQASDRDQIEILTHQFGLALRRIRLYKEVEHLAITDSLTQVFTRRYLMERFDEEVQRAKVKKTSLAFLMLDVDHFKKINDRHGHLAGDHVLREIGRAIKEAVREIDIVGRYGGEEFCVILPETSREGAHYVAERVRLAVEQRSIKAYDAVLKVTVSIGSTSFPEDGRKIPELIDKADWGLYRAKRMGRNRVCPFGVYEE